jgi:hypothetical protein
VLDSTSEDETSNNSTDRISSGDIGNGTIEEKVARVEDVAGEPISLDYDSEAGMTDDGDEDHGEIDISDTSEPYQKEYSSWKPLDNNISETRTGQRIHMTYGQTLAVLGQFDLSVLSGVVNISGAFCSSKSPIQRVTAPLTEPLPVLRCVSSDGARIDLLNVPDNENFESLSRVSRLFCDIWSCRCPNCAEMGENYTFRKVRSCIHTRDIAYAVVGYRFKRSVFTASHSSYGISSILATSYI